MSEIISIADAKERSGVRLVLTEGAPGPWGEAIKGMLHVKKISYVRVRQMPGTDDPELLAWTGIRNAPQLIADDEPAIHAWSDLIHFVDRWADTPALIPEDPKLRALMFGLIHELAAEDGLAWNRRLCLFKPIIDMAKENPNPAFETVLALARHYRYSEEAVARAPHRAAEVLGLFTRKLQEQRASGSEYLLGDTLSALDVYWATFLALCSPLSEDLCPMPDYLRQSYANIDETVRAALDPGLIEHRDFIYKTYLELPVELL